jgi:sulfite reductase alpha subunit-like flavoprotein
MFNVFLNDHADQIILQDPLMKTLHIPVLYGSQTGNSEGAAQNFASSLPKNLSTSSLTVTSAAIELDDFLEKSKATWTPLCVIICSR